MEMLLVGPVILLKRGLSSVLDVDVLSLKTQGCSMGVLLLEAQVMEVAESLL